MKMFTISMSLVAVTACGRPAASTPASTPDTTAAETCPRPSAPASPDNPHALPPLIGDQQALLQVFARGGTVLDRLSPEAADELLDSAEWNERGITTFRATRAAEELSAEQFDRLLALFGLRRQHDVIPDAACVARATCSRSTGSWCVIRNC